MKELYKAKISLSRYLELIILLALVIFFCHHLYTNIDKPNEVFISLLYLACALPLIDFLFLNLFFCNLRIENDFIYFYNPIDFFDNKIHKSAITSIFVQENKGRIITYSINMNYRIDSKEIMKRFKIYRLSKLDEFVEYAKKRISIKKEESSRIKKYRPAIYIHTIFLLFFVSIFISLIFISI